MNNSPINSGPLNSMGGSAIPPAVVITPSTGFVWRWIVTLGGVDVSDQLTGPVRVEGSEDGDMVATLNLWLGDDPVSIRGYTGQTLALDFVVLGDPEVVSRRFTGFLVQPEFDVLTRILSCTGTTRLSDTFEAMEFDAIDLTVGGSWSQDVFEETAGRSRWEYTQERMSTRRAGLNADRAGQPRLTPWYPAGIAFDFAPGSTIYQSLDISLSSLSETTNVLELEIDYRFPRYRQRNQDYSWLHPGTGGNTSLTGFNAWRADSTELPDIQMVTDAVESAGWFITWDSWYRLPGSLPELAQPWFNENIDLLLGADFVAAVRWAQPAVERYRVRLVVQEALDAVGEVIVRDRIVLDTDSDTDRLWEQSTETEDDQPVESDDPLDQLPRRDQERLDAAASTGLLRARAQLLQAQRQSTVSWQIPLAHALAVDFGQRLKLSDQGAMVTGTVIALSEEADIDSGAALLTISIAVGQGDAAAVSDALQLPAPPAFVDEVAPVIESTLDTQIGLRISSPPYNDALTGFAGSYSIGNGDPSLRYPRRFAVPTPEIPAQWRDEAVAEQPVIIRVAPPVDVLEV